MVEMLAVVAIMSIIVAITIPNGIFAKSTADERTAITQAKALQAGMTQTRYMLGLPGEQEWAAIADSQNDALRFLIPAVFPIPAGEGRDAAINQRLSQILETFEGYRLILPPSLAGSIRVTRVSDGALLFP